MALQGNLMGYNPRTRVAIVDIPGLGRVHADNYLISGREPTPEIVNPLLDPSERNTVLPSTDFDIGQTVAVRQEGSSWWLLGIVIYESNPANIVAERPVRPGILLVDMTIVTDAEGRYRMTPFANRAQINRVRIEGPGEFSATLTNGGNETQAAWGLGEVKPSETLADGAGFPFTSPDGSAVLTLSPAGTYRVRIEGERFA